MLSPRHLAGAAAIAVALATPCESHAQQDTQLWANFQLDWIRTHHWTFGLDTEPKVLLTHPSSDPGWATIDVTPSIEYARGEWVDVVGSLKTGWTYQTNDLDSTEVTPGIGIRLHLLSNLDKEIFKERHPKHRLVLRDLIRVEWRNLYYSTDKPDSSTTRLRNRFETLWPFNRPKITDDGAWYAAADWEWFIALGDEADERYANQQRIRGGGGYRHSQAWRYETMVVWDRTRNTLGEPFTTSYYALDLTMKRVW
jgi:hypothetical protein